MMLSDAVFSAFVGECIKQTQQMREVLESEAISKQKVLEIYREEARKHQDRTTLLLLTNENEGE